MRKKQFTTYISIQLIRFSIVVAEVVKQTDVETKQTSPEPQQVQVEEEQREIEVPVVEEKRPSLKMRLPIVAVVDDSSSNSSSSNTSSEASNNSNSSDGVVVVEDPVDEPEQAVAKQEKNKVDEVIPELTEAQGEIQKQLDDDVEMRDASEDPPVSEKEEEEETKAEVPEVVKEEEAKELEKEDPVKGKLEQEEANHEPLQPPKDDQEEDEEKEAVVMVEKKGQPEKDATPVDDKPATPVAEKKTEEKTKPVEEKQTAQATPIVATTYRRNLSRGGAVATPDDPAAARKRRWTSRKDDKEQVVAITTDSLKGIIEDVRPVSMNDVKMEPSPEPEERPTRKQRRMVADEMEERNRGRAGDDEPKTTAEISVVELNETREEGEVRDNDDEEEEGQQQEKEGSADREKGEQRQNGENGVDMDTEAKEKDEVEVKTKQNLTTEKRTVAASDSHSSSTGRPGKGEKNPQSSVLFITNLVRPFTLLQLKSLLARTGKIVPENGFWIDKIKSKCYVCYETEE